MKLYLPWSLMCQSDSSVSTSLLANNPESKASVVTGLKTAFSEMEVVPLIQYKRASSWHSLPILDRVLTNTNLGEISIQKPFRHQTFFAWFRKMKANAKKNIGNKCLVAIPVNHPEVTNKQNFAFTFAQCAQSLRDTKMVCCTNL